MANKTFKSKAFEWAKDLADWVNENTDTITVVSVIQMPHGILPFRVWYWED